MDEKDTFLNLVRGLALLAILSWAAGSRSFLGHPLALRMGPFWLGCRCFGLGIFITLVSLKVLDQQPTLTLWIISSACLLIGCARTKMSPTKTEPTTEPGYSPTLKETDV